MKQVLLTTIDYHEFEQLVKRTYGIKEYSFVATEECGNDSSHRFGASSIKALDPSSVLDSCDLETLEKVKQGNAPAYANAVVLDDLVRRGVLPPGEYLIEVCW